MKKILLALTILVFSLGCTGYMSRFVEKDGQAVSPDQFKKDVYECVCMTHWRSLNNLSWPIYGTFYNFYYQFSSLKDEEDKAAQECLEERGYRGKTANVR